jgi:CheY-like chemotaxis protein
LKTGPSSTSGWGVQRAKPASHDFSLLIWHREDAKALASPGAAVFTFGTAGMNQSRDNSEPPGTAGGLLYVVDDEPVLLELAVTLLEPLGYQTKTFRNPESALEAFRVADPRPALVITDYAMHTMNGLELIEECRRIHPGQKTILLSGTVDAGIYRDSAQKPDRFLAKPYHARQFVSLVQAVLKD